MQTLRWGMVGGGLEACIGEVHRIAARMDGGYELCAGCFSSTAERSRASALAFAVDLSRSYDDFQTMACVESQRSDGIEIVSIVTPNYLHFEAVACFLRVGIAVICEKPLTINLEQAQQLRQLAHQKGTFLAVTYNYVENAMVRWARQLVQQGTLGKMRCVQVEYLQDWLATDIESNGQKQATWRTQPEKAGKAGCLGDIGVHAFNLACFVSGKTPVALTAQLQTFVTGRQVDDNCVVSMRYDDDCVGSLWASQVAVGHENALRLQLIGQVASLEWQQEQPNQLILRKLGEPLQILTRNGAHFPESLGRHCRVPAGHPEGYLEAFANVYTGMRQAFNQQDAIDYPNIEVAVRDMAFIEACLLSAQSHQEQRLFR